MTGLRSEIDVPRYSQDDVEQAVTRVLAAPRRLQNAVWAKENKRLDLKLIELGLSQDEVRGQRERFTKQVLDLAKSRIEGRRT